MRRIITLIVAALTLATVAAPALANPGAPSPGPAIYAGDQQFRTKDAADLPEPTEANAHSFDDIYPFVGDANPGQLAVAEAAPGEEGFNGGRWAARPVAWTEAGEAAFPGGLPLVTNADALHHLIGMGYIEHVTEGPVRYFECPLIPVRS